MAGGLNAETIGAAMLQATSAALITTIIPENRRGPDLGTLGVLLGLGPVLGPSVGGTILSMASWRWIFFINLPIVAVALVGCRRLKRIVQEKRQHIHLNVAGNVLLSLSILALLLSLSAIGDATLVATLLFLLFALLIGGFILRELRIASPILNLRLFRDGQFALAMLAVFFFGGATSIGFIVPPYFLETVRHLSAWQSGLVNLSAPLGLMGFSRLSGKRLGKVGAKRLMGIGLTVMVVAYGVLSRMGVAWSPLLIASLLFVYGAGAGIFVPANLSAIMGAVGRETQGTMGAVQRMVQNLGIAIDTAITAVLIRIHSGVGSEGLMVRFRAAWGYAVGTLGLTLLLFAWLATRSRLGRRK